MFNNPDEVKPPHGVVVEAVIIASYSERTGGWSVSTGGGYSAPVPARVVKWMHLQSREGWDAEQDTQALLAEALKTAAREHARAEEAECRIAVRDEALDRLEEHAATYRARIKELKARVGLLEADLLDARQAIVAYQEEFQLLEDELL